MKETLGSKFTSFMALASEMFYLRRRSVTFRR